MRYFNAELFTGSWMIHYFLEDSREFSSTGSSTINYKYTGAHMFLNIDSSQYTYIYIQIDISIHHYIFSTHTKLCIRPVTYEWVWPIAENDNTY